MLRIKAGLRGFTLIEMLVASSLIIVLTAILVIAYASSTHTIRDKKRETDMKQIQVALEQYYDTYQSYPVANSISTLLSNANFTQFMQNSSIQDPLNTGVYVYTVSSNAATYQLGYTRESDQTQVVVNNIGR